MAAYQKFGVIIVTIIFSILQKIKLQNYRLFLLYEETKSTDKNDFNLTQILNRTDTLFDGDNISQFLYRCLLLSNCLAVIPCIFLTSWSDKHGRKLLMILPYVGSLLGDIVMIVVLFVPAATSKILLVSEGLDGLFGGTILISLGCLCYITDSTDHRQRTLLIAIFFGLWNASPVIDMTFQFYWTPETGIGFNGLVLWSIIYRMICAICFLIYIKFCVSESVFILGTFQGNPWSNLITPINVSDTINCVFKRRLDNMRFYIIILTTIFILYTISLFGNILTYPHYFRNVFLWPYKDVLAFSAIFTACQTLTLWFSAYLAKEWKSLDTELGLYGCISLGISCLVLTFSKESSFAAAGAVIGVGSLFVPVAIVSALSKLVERNETGSMFAGMGFLSLLCQIIATSTYSTLNDVCQDAGVPQIIFLLSFGLISFCLFFFIYLKRNISPHLLGHLNGSESLALIKRKEEIEQLLD